MVVRNKKIDWDEFQKERHEVLAQWPTGKQVDLDEAIAYHKSMPDSKNSVKKMLEAREKGITLIHSNMGYTTLQQNIDLLLYLQNEGHSDFLRSILDSFSRTQRYAEAEKAVNECEKTGKNLLNGFPVVHYGVAGCRKLVEAVDTPMQEGGPAIDSRLTNEICYAAGYTHAASGGGFNCFINYSKTTPFDVAMKMLMYGDRLSGYYQDHGVPMLCNVGSPLNATGVTPTSLGTAYTVISALLGPTQGVKYIQLNIVSQGNLIQDIAANNTRLKLCREYLDRFGFKDVELLVQNGHIDGPYPKDHAQSIVLVVYPAILSALTRSQACWIKTYDEADAIPTKENNAFSLRAVRMMIDIIKDQNIDLLNSRQVKAEIDQEEREARAIVERVLDFGAGDPLIGAKKAFEEGVLDFVLPNNNGLKGAVMGVKDANGAVRYLDFGNLPFSREIKDFHRQKVAERGRKNGKQPDYDTVVADLRALSRGSLLPKIN